MLTGDTAPAPSRPGGAGRPLGINAKSAARPGIRGLDDAGHEQQWALLSQAQRLLRTEKTARIDRYGQEREHYRYRVVMCHRGTDHTGTPGIRRSPDGRSARYEGLQTCGSVWHCPVCAPKVAAERRSELLRAFGHQVTLPDHAPGVGRGGMVYLATYTFQHSGRDAGQLWQQLDRMRQAYRDLTGSRAYRELLEACGYIGAIRAWEVTYGELNGWHPHAHALLFVDQETFDQLRRPLRKLWSRVLLKRGMAGLDVSDTPLERRRKLRNLLTRCFTLQDGRHAADYIGKFGKEPATATGRWGPGSELTKNHLKRGHATEDGRPRRCQHATPWGLLHDAAEGDARSGDLWREFARAFAGARQLYWSRGLKERFGIHELDDEQIAARPEADCTEHVIELTPELWSAVLAAGARGFLLRVAAKHGRAGVLFALRKLCDDDAPPWREWGDFEIARYRGAA